ncbi:MAG TPA: quinoprotein dehydrogenase-associated putative ABC transporter substrate-binding protein [Terracidiphilus sp.]|jgi:mxaJ protein|nr:quinoprotein dehydrogenase-associated putative ABC transporter substrate-binding protein [Terracidiphilus sp.]
MSSLCRNLIGLLCMLSSLSAFGQSPLRVCADPDDLPFSSASRAGFDNRIAEMLGRNLNRPVIFVWARARRGFLREQFNKDACDLLMGVPEGMKHVRTTIPYYRSSYVFVTRRSDHLQLTGFDDPAIGKQRIGLQILEEDFSPPSLPLIRSGHAAQFVGFDSFGNGGDAIVRAVANNKVGFSVVWGPIAGYYASRQRVPLALSPVRPAIDSTGIPFTFAMAIAVHNDDQKLAGNLSAAIRKNQGRIEAILHSYHVPFAPADGGSL